MGQGGQQQQQQQHYTTGQPLSVNPPPGFSSLPGGGGFGQGAGLQATHTIQAGLATAGLGLGNMGLQSGDVDGLFNSTQTGKSVGDGDLLASLQAATEASRRKRSKLWIRPDYHLPTDKSYEEMSYRELMFGMLNVLQALMLANHPDITPLSYLDHMKFIAHRELKPTFVMKAVNQYDWDVTNKVLTREIPKFEAANHQAMSTHLTMDKTLAYIRMQQDMVKQVQQIQRNPGQNQNRQGQSQARYRIQCPDGFCKKFNFTTCDFNNCMRAHQCAVCGAGHPARGCSQNPHNQGSQPAYQQGAVQYNRGGQAEQGQGYQQNYQRRA